MILQAAMALTVLMAGGQKTPFDLSIGGKSANDLHYPSFFDPKTKLYLYFAGD